MRCVNCRAVVRDTNERCPRCRAWLAKRAPDSDPHALVADDNPVVRRIVGRTLNRAGYATVNEADDASAVVNGARATQPWSASWNSSNRDT